MFISVLLGCTATKQTANDPPVRLLKTRASVQKVFPGVSGEVRHFIQYTAAFDLETQTEIEFLHLQISETKVPVNSVSVGTKLLNTDLGEHLKQDTRGVILKAGVPVRHTEKPVDQSVILESPEKIVVVLTAGKDTLHFETTNINFEPNEYRPSAPSGRE